ncbi:MULTISPECIES: MFS transporter [unclassified Pantoea]|uniref:MFS transporter n=1 Tax=unclassified Pantoea TaxID=2630326 RepID=UPI001CD1D35B|nr:MULTISPECIES: MFS transporter [unclassified Pantoea]MCA1175040.1 MFS transporter [Pantoea sp. alder69]MCA1250002.1 MFS transporter [Pantoea sp. alder70]MCA1264043.1 MFS transporter [Pantoea sp. alder81]
MSARLPLVPLLTLSLAAFVTIVTEALPAGLLAPMAQDLRVSVAAAGQSVSTYAIGSFLAAIPLMAMLQGVPRRRLLLLALVGFTLANAATALASSYPLMLVSRVLAGIAAGLLWALLAGYAAAMVPPEQKGKAIAIAMAGTPLALAFGVPLGTLVGNVIGWRLSFAALSGLSLLLMLILRLTAPERPGQLAQQRLPLRQVLMLPGVARVLMLVLCVVLAHNILYTYIVPFLQPAGLAARADAVLLLFGVSSLISIFITGWWVDRYLQPMLLISTLLFMVAALLLQLFPATTMAIWLAVMLWGLAFGGVATLFQTAMVEHAGKAVDVAQSMLVTIWNLAIAGGGIVGGALLKSVGVSSFAPALLLLLAMALWAIWRGRKRAVRAYANPGA